MQCNILYRKPKLIPVYFHGLANYDAHFLVNSFGNQSNRKISVIAKVRLLQLRVPEYTWFSFVCLKFLDSFAFLTTLLAQLVPKLCQGNSTQHVHFMKKYFPDPEQHSPYESISSASSLSIRGWRA